MSDLPPPPAEREPGNQQRVRVGRSGLAILGILLVAANLRTSITVVGPLLGQVRSELLLSNVAASALITIPVLCFALFSPVAPLLAARFGMERTLGGALVLLATALVLRSLPSEIGLWGGTALIGVSIATLNVILPALLKRDYPTRTGALTGLYSAMQSGFAALASGFAVPLATVGGWRFAFGFWVGLVLIALAVFWPQVMRSGRPQPTGPIGIPGAPAPLRYRSPWGSALGWQITVFMGVQSTMFYAMLTWLPSVDEANGFSTAAAGMHQSVFQLVGIAGNLFTAWMIHRAGADQRSTMWVLGPLPVVGILGLLIFPELSLLWNIVLGFVAGGYFVLVLAFFSLRTRHHRQAAAVSGMAQSMGYLLAAAVPMLLGALQEATGEWDSVLLVLLGLQAVLVVSGFLSARDRTIGITPPQAPVRSA